MTKTRLKRVVGKRVVTDPTDVADASPDDFDFNEAGQFCLRETTFVDPDDDAATAQLRKTRVEAFAKAFDKLSPSTYVAYLGLAHTLGDAEAAIAARVLSDRSPHLLIDVVLPSHRWRMVFAYAFQAILLGIATRHVFASVDHCHLHPEADRYRNGEYRLNVAQALDRLRGGHVLVTRLAADVLPPSLAPHVDVSVDLSTLPIEHVAAALDRAFGIKGASWPASLPATAMAPGWFDSACDRALDPAGVAGIVLALRDGEIAEKKASEAADAAATEKKSTTSSTRAYTPTVLRPDSPLLTDLHGYGDARTWGESLAADLALYRRGKLGWADVDAGCLLHGPPGTGKTMFASALAAACGVPFIATSYAQWQSSGDGHLGYVLKSIRATFASAVENAPCIVFIDELDTVRGRGGSEWDSWWTAIVTCLLECLDGTSRREGIVVIGACNIVEHLDPAMIRSGRLDRRFHIGLPDEDALLRIFQHHLPGEDDQAFGPAATALAGTISGADVSRFAREARRTARRAGRPVVAEDLLSIAMPPDTRSDEMRRLVAVHEAGHAVAEMIRGHVPRALSLVAADGSHGGVDINSDLGCGRLDDLEGLVVSLLAGRAAEEICLGVVSGGAGGGEQSDLHQATTLVTRIVGRFGLGGRLASVEKVLDREVEDRLRGLYGRAVALVRAHRDHVEALAAMALERRVLSQPMLAAFAGERGLLGATVSVPPVPEADAPGAEVAR
ncbi:AAA family ATPase [Aureimonas sp. N4]|uniref:AAA family ATPase n=1 Tax=Aureimonas sp. N4 TaxID=1638165 RepID=UPI0007838693|nr:AAA family ATPase [Aureimonas sp. N4]